MAGSAVPTLIVCGVRLRCVGIDRWECIEYESVDLLTVWKSIVRIIFSPPSGIWTSEWVFPTILMYRAVVARGSNLCPCNSTGICPV